MGDPTRILSTSSTYPARTRLRTNTPKKGDGKNARWGEDSAYWYLKGSRLDGGGEGSEGWILDCGHNRATICLQCGQNKGICLDNLRLDQDLDEERRGKGREDCFSILHLFLITDLLSKRRKYNFHETETQNGP